MFSVDGLVVCFFFVSVYLLFSSALKSLPCVPLGHLCVHTLTSPRSPLQPPVFWLAQRHGPPALPHRCGAWRRHIWHRAPGHQCQHRGKGAFPSNATRFARPVFTSPPVHQVAIKSISKVSIADIAEVERVSREFFILTCLEHRNVIRLIEVAQDARHLHLVMEYAGGGCLESVLKAQPHGRLSNGKAQDMFRQICNGVRYCHQKRVVHRDLKPENILLSNSGEIKARDSPPPPLLLPALWRSVW